MRNFKWALIKLGLLERGKIEIFKLLIHKAHASQEFEFLSSFNAFFPFDSLINNFLSAVAWNRRCSDDLFALKHNFNPALLFLAANATMNQSIFPDIITFAGRVRCFLHEHIKYILEYTYSHSCMSVA